MTARRGSIPGLFCGVPLVTSIALLIPEFGPIWGSIGAVVVLLRRIALLIQAVRDRGKALEARLYRSWGGKPSVAMLRQRDNRLGQYDQGAVPAVSLWRCAWPNAGVPGG